MLSACHTGLFEMPIPHLICTCFAAICNYKIFLTFNSQDTVRFRRTLFFSNKLTVLVLTRKYFQPTFAGCTGVIYLFHNDREKIVLFHDSLIPCTLSKLVLWSSGYIMADRAGEVHLVDRRFITFSLGLHSSVYLQHQRPILM